METRLSIEIDEDLKKKFKMKALNEDKTIKRKMIELINKYLQEQEK